MTPFISLIVLPFFLHPCCSPLYIPLSSAQSFPSPCHSPHSVPILSPHFFHSPPPTAHRPPPTAQSPLVFFLVNDIRISISSSLIVYPLYSTLEYPSPISHHKFFLFNSLYYSCCIFPLSFLSYYDRDCSAHPRIVLLVLGKGGS